MENIRVHSNLKNRNTRGIFEVFQVIHRINTSELKRLQKFYAHSIEGKPLEEWHTLEEHLKGTAELSAKFADDYLH